MQTRTLALSGIGAVALALALAIYLRPLEQIAPAPPQGADAAVEAGDGVLETSQGDGSDAPDATSLAQTGTDEQPADVAPQITAFRFEPDGAMLVSGLAQPGVPLGVMIDGREVARMDVGADGTFVVTQFLGFSDAPRVMSLVSDPDGAAIEAERRFVLAANPAPDEGEAVEPDTIVIADAVGEDETSAMPDAAQSEGLTDEAPASDAPAIDSADIDVAQAPDADAQPATPATPVILSVDADGVDVVQPAIAADAPPDVMSTVALDTITYDIEGDVILSGRAPNDGFVQVYVNNAPVSRLPIAPDGTWRTDLPDVDTGVYTLRIDEVDAEGTVVSRIETPFLREAAEDVVAAMADDVADPGFTIATRTVQPGATLWAIAEERYGSGVLYVNVFEANRDRIRDPDLIYPGQVFMLPESDN